MRRKGLIVSGVAVFALILTVVVYPSHAKRWGSGGMAVSETAAPAFVSSRAVSPDSFLPVSESPMAPDFAPGTWINSEPLSLKALRGRVVLVEFWTFGCYNCRNTLPSVKNWDARYRDKGLTVVGVHSPELAPEKKLENVRREVASLGVHYPVVTDNAYETWKAYNVDAWPTIFVLDKSGKIRWTHVGEGAYEKTEQVIQKLLAEDKSQAEETDRTASRETTVVMAKIVKSDEAWRKELSPEQYRVLRQAGTERSYTGAYWNNHEKGVYYCAACGLPLFSSDTKFDSGTGWPSFYAPVSSANITNETDVSYSMVRTEVKCRRCGSHLGHVFDDGPEPTGLRYCMNSVALKFVKQS